MKPPAFSVDRFWLERLAMGGGRDERLDGMQRHFVNVVDGLARPIGADEKAALADYHRMRADMAPVSLGGDADPAPNVQPDAGLSAGRGRSMVPLAAPSPMQADALHARVLAARERAATMKRQQPSGGHRAKPADSALTQVLVATKSGLREVGDTLDGVVRSREDIREAVDDAMRSSGESAHEAGVNLAKAAKNARAAVGRAGDSTRAAIDEAVARFEAEGREGAAVWTGLVGRAATALVEVVGKVAAGATELTGMAVAAAGAKTAKHSDTIGVVVAGTLVGAAGMAGGAADAVAVSDDEIRTAKRHLDNARMAYGEKRKAYLQALAQRYPGKRERLMEQFTIGGLTLSGLVASERVPDEIAAAYAAAYPAESRLVDFREKVDSLSSGAELEGLVNGVKGKLFEMKYVEELNAGGLPEGWHAELATSATQPGWDLQIVDGHGTAQELISAKATEHLSYINEALHRYPDIDVVTTSEVYAAMAGTPEGAHLIDGGLSHVEVHDATRDAVDGRAGGVDEAVLSAVALGPAAFAHFSSTDRPMAERTAGFSRQVGRAKTASMAGSAAVAALPLWPVAFLSAMGISIAASVGNNKREQLQRLIALRDQVREATRAQHEKLEALHAPPRRSVRS